MATGAGSLARRGRQRDGARRQRSVEDRTRSDFVPVVILGVDPEHGDGRHAVIARHLFGQLQRGQRLEQREERTAEKPGLLAGDDGDGAAVGELPGGLARARRRAAALLLGAGLRRSRRADACAPASAGSRRPRRPFGRVAGEKAARPRESRTRSRPRAGGSTGSGGRRPPSVAEGSPAVPGCRGDSAEFERHRAPTVARLND